MHRTLAGLAALLIAATAQAGGMDTNDAWTGADKTKHLEAGFLAGTLVSGATGRPVYGFAAGAAFGLAKELVDMRANSGHHASLQDAAVTAIGGALGAYTGGVAITYVRGRIGVAIGREF